MAATIPIRTTHRERREGKEERLDTHTKRVLILGVGGSALLALLVCLIMFRLRPTDHLATAGPDTSSPIIAPDHPRRLIDFSLTDQLGRTVSANELRGKIVVVNFLFTSCSIVCPYVTAQMKEIQDATAGHSDLRLLSLTLDPQDDTVSVLKNYAAHSGALPQRWSFLTGDTAQIRRLIGTSFLAQDTSGQFSYMPGNFANTQCIVLVNRQGEIVSYFDGLNQEAARAALGQIQKLEVSHP